MALAYLAFVILIGYIVVLIVRSKRKPEVSEAITVTGPDTIEVPATPVVQQEKVVRKPRRAAQAKKVAPAAAPKTRKPRTVK
jgi:hypothetical protein